MTEGNDSMSSAEIKLLINERFDVMLGRVEESIKKANERTDPMIRSYINTASDEAAKKAVAAYCFSVGIDPNNVEHMNNHRRDFEFLRQSRIASEDMKLRFRDASTRLLIPAILIAAWEYVKKAFPG